MKRVFSYILPLIVLVGINMSCKKDNVKPIGDGIDRRKEYLSDEHENKIRDSVWYYYKVFSLWEQYVPPRTSLLNKMDEKNYLRDNFTKYFKTGEDVLDYLMGLTKQSGQAVKDNYDWYSYIDRDGVVSGAIGEGKMTDFGLYVGYVQTAASGTNAFLYVVMTDVNSSAYKAGLRRGDRILSINGDSNIDYNTQKTGSFKIINGYFNLSSMTIKVLKQDGTTIEKAISSAPYYVNPIVEQKVLVVNNKKVGYFNYGSFLGLDALFENNGSPKTMKQSFDELFQGFENQGISELVIDLRYNGGGSVATAEYLADCVAPLSSNRQLMYKYSMNDLLTKEGWTKDGDEFGPVYFSKRGGLNLSRVYFLVSSSTASASELLINSLKPYMNVYMIGTYTVNDNNKEVAENTYGKPAGFFGYQIVDKNIEIYVTSFKMYNKNNEGDYFKGLVPNNHVWEFSKFYDFGNPSESMLSSALSHISSGSFNLASSKIAAVPTGKTGLEKAFSYKLKSKHTVDGMYRFNDERVKLR